MLAVGHLCAPALVQIDTNSVGGLRQSGTERGSLKELLAFAPRRICAVLGSPFGEQRVGELCDLVGAAGESAAHAVGHADDLAHQHSLTLTRRYPRDTEPLAQQLLEPRSVQRAGRVGVRVDRLAIERAPLAIGAAHPIQDRAVRVQLRITNPRAVRLARSPVPELRDNEPVGVDTTHTATTGAGMARIRFEVGEALIDRLLMRVDDHLPRLGISHRPQHRHRLRRREGHVQRGDLLQHPLPTGALVDHPRRRQRLAERHQLAWAASSWVDRQRHRARVEEHAVQELHVVGVHLAGQAERVEPAAGPHTRRLTRARVVVVAVAGDRAREVLVPGPRCDLADRCNHDPRINARLVDADQPVNAVSFAGAPMVQGSDLEIVTTRAHEGAPAGTRQRSLPRCGRTARCTPSVTMARKNDVMPINTPISTHDGM